VVVGSMLASAPITASLVTGDSFDASIRDLGRTFRGPVDELVNVSDADGRTPTEAAAAVEAQASPAIDAALGVISTQAALSDVGDDDSRRAEPSADVVGLDLAAAQRFGVSRPTPGSPASKPRWPPTRSW